jgi:MerR family mercuric resistance operon transcriptional regulator
MNRSEYTIGELAKAAEVPTSTVRYYERRRLIQPDNRSQGNYRLYGQDALERLRFIRAAQATGFTLDDVMTLLELRVAADKSCDDVQVLMEERLADIKKRMAELRHVEQVLNSFLKKCRQSNRPDHCAVIEELNATCCPAPPKSQARSNVTRMAKALQDSGVESRYGSQESRLRLEVLRLVAQRRPVSSNRVEQIALSLGMESSGAVALVHRGSERDSKGRVVGILGLSQKRHPHRFEFDGVTFWTWCAWDALFLPSLLRTAAEVESVCPMTKDKIRLKVSPKKVLHLAPRDAVLTIVVPQLAAEGPPAVEEMWTSFCQHVYFFRSEQAATQWVTQNSSEAQILSVDEAYELGQRVFADLRRLR